MTNSTLRHTSLRTANSKSAFDSYPTHLDGSLKFGRDALIRMSEGTLLGRSAPRLPAPPLLAFDEVWNLRKGGKGERGGASASIDLRKLHWAFDCHFYEDPILPGSLILDGLLQLVGLCAAVHGFRGQGRATRVGSTSFRREVTPADGKLEYRIEILHTSAQRQAILANGVALVDGEPCVEAEKLFVIVKNRPRFAQDASPLSSKAEVEQWALPRRTANAAVSS